MNLKASVIIPTFNKLPRLELVLESFRFQSEEPENFELIIVDDGSWDETEKMVKGIDSKFKINYIKQENLGRSHARNKGIKNAKHKIVIFCDDDCIVSKDFIKEHLKAHFMSENSVVHGHIYNLPYMKFFKNPTTGELYNKADSQSTDLTGIRKYLISLSEIENFSRIDRQKKDTFFERQIKNIYQKEYSELKWLGCTGGNVSCPLELLKQVGLFDEELDQRWGCEDLELGYRLYKYGANFHFCNEACNYHISHFRKTYYEDLKFSMSRFYEKHKDSFIINLPLLLLGEVKSVEQYIEICKQSEVGS